jgi:hypothetical protein
MSRSCHGNVAQHTLDLTSTSPSSARLFIPAMERGSEHVVAVRLGKADTDITVRWPYFEAYSSPSQGALAALDAARKKNPALPPGEDPPSSYVSEKQHHNAGLNMYFSVSPSEAENLTTYDWVECLSHSRKYRLQKRNVDESSSTSCGGGSRHFEHVAIETLGHVTVGDPEPDEDDATTSEHCDATPAVQPSTSVDRDDAHVSHVRQGEEEAPSGSEIVFGISDVRNVFYFALYAPVALRHVEVIVLSNVPLRARDDIRHPLRMCRLHHVTGDSYDTAVEWITRKRTSLLQGLLTLTEDGCEVPLGSAQRRAADGSVLPDGRWTFLHVIAENLGDPRFARMLMKHCSRFLRKDDKDMTTHRTALQCLFLEPPIKRRPNYANSEWRARSIEVNSAAYYRMLELLRLLVEEVHASLDEEDTLGNTVVHYAACSHRRGSELLPVLLMMGAPPSSVNLDGKTPAQEMLGRQRTHHLMTWDVDEALELFSKYNVPYNPVLTDDDEGGGMAVDGTCRSAEDGTLAAVTQHRREEVSQYIGHGVDLPRVPLKLVDVVPLKIRPFGADSMRAFPTPVIQVDDTGYPVSSPNRSKAVLESTRTSICAYGEETGVKVLEASSRHPPEQGTDDTAISADTLELLKTEFASLDRDGEGWIPVSNMRRAYLSFDGYGVSESTTEIDKMISVMGIRRDGKVTFDDYCILMLRMNRL